MTAHIVNTLKLVKEGKISKTAASRKLKVSRMTLYRWLNTYNFYKNKVIKSKSDLFRHRLLQIISANPAIGPQKISAELDKCNIKASPRTVWLTLRDLGIETSAKRRRYISMFRKPGQLENKNLVGHLRLTPDSRRKMIEEVTVLDRKLKDVSPKYGQVSRKTFSKWKKRYLEARDTGENLNAALADQNLMGSDHPRGVGEDKVRSVLDLIISDPYLSSHKIAERLGVIGNHGVQKILERNNLNLLEERVAYSKAHASEPFPAASQVAGRTKSVLEQFIPSLAPAPPPSGKTDFRKLLKIFSVSSILTAVVALSLNYWMRLLGSSSFGGAVGLTFALIALATGSFFFLYSLKYYFTLALVLSFSQRGGKTAGESEKKSPSGFLSWLLGSGRSGAEKMASTGLEPDLDHVTLNRKPFVSIHIPFYNEKNVVERAIEAATGFEYPEYEVILCDDSTDETITLIQNYQNKCLAKGEKLQSMVNAEEGWELTWVEVRPGVTLKHLHRTSRSGFKGGALNIALKLINPKTEFISVFDADFVPYPDSLTLFLKYFKAQNNMSEDYSQSKVAAVQGYQWHVLNKSENWITRGVRSEYSGSYVIERSGEEIYQGLKQISGSVYMIRRAPLEEIGWGTSITEDFELTLKLYDAGYKVVYTPYIQAPAECVSTLKRFIRQRMRWAEGHSFNIKKMFVKLITNPKLSRSEKFEFLYLSPYYLQAFFFLAGTMAWLISETIFKARLPFWTSLWGWSLVLTNMVALPLMNAVGMFLEESEEKDYMGLFSFILLSYMVVPFQAYAALKGFLEKEEGTWFRTPKTGRITDIFARSLFARFIQGIMPGKVESLSVSRLQPTSPYLALTSAGNNFNRFEIKNKNSTRAKFVRGFALSFALLITLTTAGILKVQHAGREINLPEFLGNGLKLTSAKNNYLASERPEFILNIDSDRPENNGNIIRGLNLPGVKEAKAAELNSSDIELTILYRNSPVEVKSEIFETEPGVYKVFLEPGIIFKPGKYKLKTTIKSMGEDYSAEKDFSWGVLSVNTKKSIYLPGETVKFGFGVIDDVGRTICDAKIKMTVFVPSENKSYVFSSQNGLIKNSEHCARESVTNEPDYFAEFTARGAEEEYLLTIEAESYNGIKTVKDKVTVKKEVPFDIERTSYPTRIYPKADYPVSITIRANQDFNGRIEEAFPQEFIISDISGGGEFDGTKIKWNMKLAKGESRTLSYIISFPLRSPEFYLIGPLTLTDKAGNAVFKEVRPWQIASDAPAHVQTQFAVTASGLSVSCASMTMTAGNLITVMGYTASNASTISVADTQSNTYQTAIGPLDAGTARRIYLFYAENIAGGATQVTVTISGSTNRPVGIICSEYSGLATSGSLDQTSTATGTTETTLDSGSKTTTQANELIVGIAEINPNAVKTAGTGFTRRGWATSTAINSEDKVVSSTGSYNATMTIAAGGTVWGMGMATFSDTTIPENGTILMILSPFLFWLTRRFGRKQKTKN